MIFKDYIKYFILHYYMCNILALCILVPIIFISTILGLWGFECLNICIIVTLGIAFILSVIETVVVSYAEKMGCGDVYKE